MFFPPSIEAGFYPETRSYDSAPTILVSTLFYWDIYKVWLDWIITETVTDDDIILTDRRIMIVPP